MNIERYKLPVIIAAGLHGALFLCMTETEARPIVLLQKPVSIYTPIPIDDPIVQPPEPSDDPAATNANTGASPLPRIPDVVQPLTGQEPFTVPVEAYKPVINPVDTLIDHRGPPTGTEFGPGNFGPIGIPGVDALDRIPRAVVQNAPAYPDDMRRGGVNGSVTVQFVVDTNGHVIKAEAVKWSHREFVDPAVRAVLRWRFQPGTQEGRKVSFRMAVPIEFNTER